MQILEAVQGSPEWHRHRLTHFNASDAPAMMGVSKYKTRDQLLSEIATGIIPDVDEATQCRFDDGHTAEALARPLAEEIIGRDLYPVTGFDGEYSASFDGLTDADDIDWEHKALNDEIRACQCAADLHLMYRIQMEQQLMVSGAGKCLFMASKWKDDELVEEKHFWYEPDLKLRAQIVQGWEQLKQDAAKYVPQEYIPAATAAPTLALPALSIKVEGKISLIDNLPAFGEGLKAFIERLPKEPKTDQDFADLKKAISTLQEAQDALDAAEASALGQMASFDVMKRNKLLWWTLARDTRLATEKMVVAQEKLIKEQIVMKGRDDFAAHLATLTQQLGNPYLPPISTDFATAIKNKRTIATLRDAVTNELTRAKLAANDIANRIQINLNTLRDLASKHEFLFADKQQIVLKATDDLTSLVKLRIKEHDEGKAKEAEDIRKQAEIDARAKIEAENKAKAEAEAKAKAEQIARDAAAALAATTPPVPPVPAPAPATEARAPAPVPGTMPAPIRRGAPPPPQPVGVRAANTVPLPSDDELLTVLSLHFHRPKHTIIEWIADFDIAGARERYKPSIAA